MGHRGGKSGGKVNIDYHWVFSIANVKVIKKPIISFRSFLGNIVFIGDGITTSFKIPNKWEKMLALEGGYYWTSSYPEEIIVYKDTINNRLVEGVDYTYNKEEGTLTFTTPPEKNSLIAITCTYDPTNPRETTFYASFVFAEIFKRIGFKYYKFKEDYLNTYRKVALMSKSLLDVLWTPMMTGSLDIVYNPLVELGQTIYVKDPKTGFENVVFVKGFNKSLGRSPSLSLEVLNYPSCVEISNFGDTEIGTRFKLQLPILFISFIDETNDSNDYYGDVVWFRSEVLDIYGDKFNLYKNPAEISFKLGDKIRTFPSSENDFNKYYPNASHGILTQLYSCIFRKSSNGEFVDDNDLKNTFPEFFDTNPKLFAVRETNITIKDTKTNAKNAMKLSIYYAAKKPFKGYFVPCYPYDPFITFADNREKIYIIDKDKRLWKVDTFLNSSLIDTLNFIDEDTFCIVNCGKEIMIVDDQAKYIRKYNPSTKTYNSYEVNDCLCVKPDTLVYGKGYVKPIKDFKVEEEVLTHTGRYCKINKILTRFYKGNLIKIKIYNGEDIATTPEHPILTTEGWKEAKDIKVGDKIIEVFDNKVEDKEYIYLTDFLDQKIIEKIKYDSDYIYLPNFNPTKIKKVKNKIKIDKYFLELVGLYLAEGSIGYQKKGENKPFDKLRVNFYFGKTLKEEKLAYHSAWLVKKVFGIDCKIRRSLFGVKTEINSVILANFFNLFGTKSDNKKILDWIMYLLPRKQIALISGFLKGDGNIRRFKTKIRFNQSGKCYKQCQMKTVSLQLAYQLRTLLKRIGIISGLGIRKEGYYKIFNREKEVFCLRQYIIGWSKRAMKNTIKDNYYIREVREVSKEYYEGLVYNFNVAEDNSYTIAGATVHNCGCNVYMNHKNITDENGFPLFYFRGYSNITDTPYISYVNFIKYKSFSNEMAKTKWSFSINNKVFAGIPFVYGNVVYFGKIGMNLKNAGSYEGNWQWFSEESCSLIVDNCNLVFKNDVPNLNKIKCVYTTDLMENTLYVVGSDCSEATDYILTQPRVIGKEVIFGKRKDKIYDENFDPSTDSIHWEKIAKFTTSDNNDIKSWDIFPITVYGNKILCLVKGSEPSRKIKNFNFGLAVFDPSDKSLHFKIIKYYGESIEGTRSELELTHSVWFKDKVLYNWKDFDYILALEDVEVIKGE